MIFFSLQRGNAKVQKVAPNMQHPTCCRNYCVYTSSLAKFSRSTVCVAHTQPSVHGCRSTVLKYSCTRRFRTKPPRLPPRRALHTCIRVPLFPILFCGLFSLSENIKTFILKEILNLSNKSSRLVQTFFKIRSGFCKMQCKLL